jgi:hypothetical protein
VIADDLTQEFVEVLGHYSDNRPRTHQGRKGYIGPSDLGFCRQKALLTMRQTEQDPAPEDEVPMWAADVGSAVHEWVDAAFSGRDGWVIGSEYGRVTATFPDSAAEVSGHFDLMHPDRNILVDIKTVEDLGKPRRFGISQNYLFQGHTYALGLIQAGVLDENCTLAWVFLDRSGREKKPYVVAMSYDPTIIPQIDSWISDVIYAQHHGEDAERDIPAPVCYSICRYFTTCRGVLEDTHETTLITDPDLLSTIDMYMEGQEMKKQGEQMMKVAKGGLANVAGATPDGVQVRWVRVESGRVEAYDRAAFDRLDVKRIKKRTP